MNSELFYTLKTPFLYDNWLLTNTIVFYKKSQELSSQFIEQLTLVKRHSFQMSVRLSHVIGTKVKGKMQKLTPSFRKLLSSVLSLWPERLHKLTEVYFLPAFPRPYREKDSHLTMLVVDFCKFYLLFSLTYINYFTYQIELKLSSLVVVNGSF